MLTELQKRKLVKIFSMYDSCNTGSLTVSDFEKIPQALAEIKEWKPNSEEHTKLLNKFMTRWIRIQRNVQKRVSNRPIYKIQLEDWLRYHDLMLDSEAKYQDEIHSLGSMIFDVCDVDDSGHLDTQEWVTLFRAFNLPAIYAKEAFSKLDKNQDGLLQREEVLNALRDFYYSDDPNEAANFMFGPY